MKQDFTGQVIVYITHICDNGKLHINTSSYTMCQMDLDRHCQWLGKLCWWFTAPPSWPTKCI